MKTHLHGPSFRDWIYEQRPELDGMATAVLSESDCSSLRRWKTVVDPIEYAGVPDRIMTKLDLHEWEIPTSIWRDAPVQKGAVDALARARAERDRKRRALAGLREVNGVWVREAA